MKRQLLTGKIDVKILHLLILLHFSTQSYSQSESVVMHPMPEAINTKDHEELSRWNIDGNSLVFTRLTDRVKELYIARFDNSGALLKVEPFPFDTAYNGGGHTISPDGKSLVFTLCDRADGMGNCDLYISQMQNGAWSTPKNMGPAVNSTGWDVQPVFGADGASIFFVSSRQGGFGGSDIWMSLEQSPGVWSKAVNLGPGVNTNNNEGSPYIHFDGLTMYFMRDGSAGFGGYDLYITHLSTNGKWTLTENMGGAINTSANEGGMAIHPDGKTAIMTRATKERKNDLFTFELPAKYRAASLQALHVMVNDEQTHKPLRARLEIYEVEKFDTIRLSQWSDKQGKISTSIQKNKKYGLIADADGYLPYSANLEADTSSMRDLVIKMTSIEAAKNKVLVMQNVFFETGSAELLAGSTPELKKLISTMTKNPAMKIEIRGHTDNVGSDATNQQLSEARAKAVYDYLTANAIAPSRLTYLGFGEKQPVGNNATEEGRRQNRRTEVKVVDN